MFTTFINFIRPSGLKDSSVSPKKVNELRDKKKKDNLYLGDKSHDKKQEDAQSPKDNKAHDTAQLSLSAIRAHILNNDNTGANTAESLTQLAHIERMGIQYITVRPDQSFIEAVAAKFAKTL